MTYLVGSPLFHADKTEGQGRFELEAHWLPDATAEADSSCTEEKTSLVGATGKWLLPRWVITSGHTGSKWKPGVRCLRLMDEDPEAQTLVHVEPSVSQTFPGILEQS